MARGERCSATGAERGQVAKRAVVAAKAKLADYYQGLPPEVRVEEVRFPEGEERAHITLSFVSAGERVYKLFEVDALGIVLSMKRRGV